ncbi:MAG: hypothetical protein VX107_12530, partial [Pseudomonadota bacterium]|nr:hypothetical protein [Pseudomonadota bacterium]
MLRPPAVAVRELRIAFFKNILFDKLEVKVRVLGHGNIDQTSNVDDIPTAVVHMRAHINIE